jgi:hypothetical protein
MAQFLTIYTLVMSSRKPSENIKIQFKTIKLIRLVFNLSTVYFFKFNCSTLLAKNKIDTTYSLSYRSDEEKLPFYKIHMQSKIDASSTALASVDVKSVMLQSSLGISNAFNALFTDI